MMALGDGLDIDKMMRGGYGSRADLPSATEVPPAPAPYVAPADLGGFVDELSQGGPAPRPADQPTRTATTPAPRPTVRTKMAADIAAEIGLDMSKPPSTPQEAAQQAEILRADEAAFRMGAPGAVDAAAGLSQQGGQAFDEAFAMAGQQVRMPSGPNPQKPIVTQGSAAAQEAIGEQRVAREAVGDATIAQEQAISALLSQQGLRNEIELAAAQDRERMAAERLAQQVGRVQEAEQRVVKASADLARKPDVDPGRFWASRTAGQKAGFAIVAILGGIGGVDTTGIIADAITRDIDAQKTNIDKATGERDAAEADFDVARRTFGEMLALTEDQRAAEAMYEASRWQAAKADLTAKAAEFGVPLTQANVAQQMAEFDERIAEATMRWQQLVAATPSRIGGGTRSPYTPLQEKMMVKRAESGLDAKQTFAGKAIDIAGEQETERIKAAAAAAEGPSLEERKHDDAMLSDLSKQLAPVETYLNLGQNLLDDYERTGDIAGFGNWTPFGIGQGHEMTEEARNFRQAADLFRETAVTDLTGANSSPAQQAAADALKRAQSEEEVAAAIRLVMQMGAEKKQSILRGKKKHIQDAYMQTSSAPTVFGPCVGAAGRVDRSAVVTED